MNARQLGAIQIESVAKSYGDTEVLSAVNLSIAPGSFVTLLGPSGCGKTTLLRLIAGFINPTGGRISIDGKDMAGIPTQRRPIGMVFQNLALFPHLNVFENIAYGLQLRKRPKDEIARRVAQFIEIVGLAGLGERRIAQLSGGQKQRVALARSLVLEPSILLLDEPLSALDLQLRKQLQVSLKDIQRKLGTTFVFVTHDQEEATLMSDTIVVMSQGRVQQVANPSTVYSSPANLFVAKFIGELNELPARITAAGASLLLQTDAGKMALPASAAHGFTPAVGAAATLCLRPESLVVSTGPVPAHHTPIAAQLIDVVSLGPVSRLILDVAGHRLTSIVMSEARPADLLPGAQCSVHFDPEKARVYAPLASRTAQAFGEAA